MKKRYVDTSFLRSCVDPNGDNSLAQVILSPNNNVLKFDYENWERLPKFYPDIHVRVRSDSRVGISIDDIGKYETLDQAKERIKKWFNNEVIPLYLMNAF